MKIAKSMLFFICVISLLLVLPATATATEFSTVEQRVTTSAADHWNPVIDGSIVAYNVKGPPDTDIWYTDMFTGLERPVSVIIGNQQLAGISDNKIVYTDFTTNDILIFDIMTGQTENLTGEVNSNVLDPAISHNLVAWKDDFNGGWEIVAKDLSTGEVRRISDDLCVDGTLAVDNGIIVWQQCDAENVSCVFAYDWATGTTEQLTDTYYGEDLQPDVCGHTVVYQVNRDGQYDIAAYDLNTGTETFLQLEGNQVNPHISDDVVLYEEQAGEVYQICLWQLSTSEHFQPYRTFCEHNMIDIDSRFIAFSDGRNAYLDIYMIEFAIENTPEEKYKVAYDGNGYTGGTEPIDSNLYTPGNTVAVSGNSGGLVKTGCSFAGWNTQTDGNGTTYSVAGPGNTFVMGNSNVRLYAKWLTPSDLIADQISYIDGLNLDKSTSKSYFAKLDSVSAYLANGDKASATAQLNALMQELTAQSGKHKISEGTADELIQNIQFIISVISQ